MKARIQQWENAENSLSRKEAKDRGFRQWLYSDSSSLRRDDRKVLHQVPQTGSLRRGDGRDLRQWRDAPGQVSDEVSGEGKSLRRIRMSSTGSMLGASDALAVALQEVDGLMASECSVSSASREHPFPSLSPPFFFSSSFTPFCTFSLSPPPTWSFLLSILILIHFSQFFPFFPSHFLP